MDYKFGVSIYAAIISTIVFFWRLYEFYLDRRGKLKISNSYITQLPIDSNQKIGNDVTFFVVTIINLSKNKRQIEIPRFKLDTKINGKEYFNFLDFNTTEKFPKALEPGDKFLYKVNSKAIDENFRKTGVSEIKTIIIDTYGKKYYSDWFKL
ncbi:MAG: hypothetical protein B7Y83_15250 [Flavobacteriales bacterium 32-34-25]|nr:MAG: hypothetical protein B7Y83_15250 [Flavobacteriales bacterium 32-34-25]